MPGRVLRLALRRVLVVATLLALVALPFAGQYLYDDVRTELGQRSLARELASDAAPRPVAAVRRPGDTARAVPVASPAPTGRALATLEVPRFGRDWRWVVVEGTEAEQLDRGPGHYVGAPLFGDVGNVSVAAHRAGHGSPFLDFDRLRRGDEVRVTQGDVTWTYALTQGPRVIAIEDTWVLDPLPGRKLTLTTCWPKYGSSRRMYVVAELVAVDGRVL